MPIASPEVYAEMLDRAKAGGFAYPAINCTSSQTINAALRGFAEAESDGIIQVSWGGANFASGATINNMVDGAIALAEFAHVVAEKFPVNVALHTDHCPPDKLDGYMRPLIAISQERVAAGKRPLFQSHMWDGSAVELEENLKIARELLDGCAKANIVMELEIGVVGGEEDGVSNEINEKLYTHPADAMRTAEVLGLGENGRYLLAATFGNVHGSYKPGAVKLKPGILKEIQDEVGKKFGKDKPFDLVFHGGSGSMLEEIRETLGTGERGRYMLAATFGNVHGVYKPGNVKLRPAILKQIQDAVGAEVGRERPFDLVFHGGSGSLLEEIRETLDYGVVKMNVDTDTQYAFTRPIAAHMFTHYDGVLKVDGEVGDKKTYDPRSYGKAAETSMAARVVQACEDLRSAGQRLT